MDRLKNFAMTNYIKRNHWAIISLCLLLLCTIAPGAHISVPLSVYADLSLSSDVEEGSKVPPSNDLSSTVNPHLKKIPSATDEIQKWHAKKKVNVLLDLWTRISSPFDMKEIISGLKTGKHSPVTCFACKFGVSLVQHIAEKKKSGDDIVALVKVLCNFFKIESARVCQGVTQVFQGEVLYVFERLVLSPQEVCGLILGDTCSPVYNPYHNWTVPLTPFPKPPVKPVPPPKTGAPTTRVLHLSDTHFDPYYREGSNAECGEPLCCRIADGPAPDPSKAAGKWGDYRSCDTPLQTLEHMLKHIRDNHKVDYVLWTGDIPPHDVWNSSQSEQISLLKSVTQLMNKYLKNIPIFSAIGNHESSPVNSFPMPQITGKYDISWLYDEIAKTWAPWVPRGAEATIKKGAYFSVKVNPGLKIISINTNYCNNQNWWLLLNSTDPAEELQWLIQELQASELIGEKVHIIGHIPPGTGSCLQVWSHNYYRIINRFESTVVAQFYGHTHSDEFEVFYDTETLKHPTNIAYIGPSVTTFGSGNPAFRIYTVDGNYAGSSRVVLDHETYFLNLTEANLFNQPTWRKTYSVKEHLEMKSLLPHDWNTLIQRFESNDTLFQRFYRYYRKMSDYHNEPCIGDCKKSMLCNLRSGRSHDPSLCNAGQ
ncbi:sphingomyelin phosphodiesterase-like [Tachypleus tridentatus]|uniref:sphingomyelin phosphodiesterase-like n=1 Tax=Tachypleus tridentatus TaxID=6853 RepID=UPI003FD1147E